MQSIRDLGVRVHPLLIVLVYVLFSVAWIVWSDVAVERAFTDPATLTKVQSFKGVAYVLASAGILYGLMMLGLKRQRRTVDELTASRARFSDLADLSADWYWETDTESRFTYLSEGFERGTGIAPSALIGKRRDQLDLDPAKDPVWRHHLNQQAQRRPFRDFVYRSRLVEGLESHYFAVSGKPQFDASGRFLGYCGATRDVTKQVLADQAIHDTELKLRTVLDALPVSLFTVPVDNTAGIELVNQTATQMFGYSAEELQGMSPLDLSPEYQPDGALSANTGSKLIKRALKGETVVAEWLYRRADGTDFPGEVRVTCVELDGRESICVGVVDITDRKHAEIALAERTALLETIIKVAPVAINIRDKNLRYHYANKRYASLFGLEPEALVGHTAEEATGRRQPPVLARTMEVLEKGRSFDNVEAQSSRFPEMTNLYSQVPVEIDGERNVLTIMLDITERKRAEREIERRQELFETVCDSLPAMITLRDENGRFIYTNQKFKTVFGYPETDLIGKTVTDLEGPVADTKNNGEHIVMEVAKTGKAISNMEFAPTRRPGEYLLASWTPVSLGDDGTTAVLGVSVDIAAQKKTEHALRENAATLRFLNQVTATVNEAESVEEALDKSLETIRSFMGWPMARATLLNWMNGNETPDIFESVDPGRRADEKDVTRLACVDGSRCSEVSSRVRDARETVWLEKAELKMPPAEVSGADANTAEGSYVVFPIISGEEVIATIELYNDRETARNDRIVEALGYAAAQLSRLLERSKAAFDLRRSETRYRSLIDQSSQAMIVHDELNIVLANLAAARMFGFDDVSDLMAIETLDKLFKADAWPEIRRVNRAALEGELTLPETVEANCVRKDGSAFVMRGHPAVVEWGDGTMISCSLTDVSRSQEIEERKRQAQRMESLGQLTGGIAHDFNNLLGIIVGSAGLLERDLSDQPSPLKRLNLIKHAADRGAKMTRKMLGFARNDATGSSLLRPEQVIPVLEDMLQKSLTQEVDLRFRLAPETWALRVDSGELEDAIINLVVNARDAIDARDTTDARNALESQGEIVVEMSNTHIKGEPEIQDGDYVLIAVSDNGSGMPRDVAQNAFDPFFTTKNMDKGTGLGLSMVYGFARRFGGHVRLYSELGHGTTVKMFLPRAMMGDTIAAPVMIEQETPGGTETLLVVDDEPALLEIAQQTLEELGYQVRTASSAEDALKILRTDRSIDLLFTDVVMPGGQNGIGLSTAARRLREDLPVVLTSGFSAQLQGRGYDPELIGSMLAKPYDRGGLGRAIRAALDASRVTPPRRAMAFLSATA